VVYENDKFWSHFNANKEIKLDNYLLTVLSGSSWSGGHAAMFLEHFDAYNLPETLMIDLISFGGGSIQINIEQAQVGLSTSIIDCTYTLANTNETHTGMPKSQERLVHSHHRSYYINAKDRDRFMTAVRRFARKVDDGRYVYVTPGGLLGRIGSGIGKRGINCADFVIKVLNESGIANRYNTLFTTPSRVAKVRT